MNFSNDVPELSMNKRVDTQENLVTWSSYNVEIEPCEDTNGLYLLYNTSSGKMVTSRTSFQDRLDYYANGNVLEEQDSRLVDLGFLVQASVDELAYTRFQYQQLTTGRTQQLHILPTEQCNFRCVYCYEEFLKGQMSEELQNGLATWVEKNIKNWDKLFISWFGGEPLVGYQAIVRLSRKLLAICEQNQVEYISGMTTNAYLLSLDRAQELYDLGVRSYQITIDGTEEYHDRTRLLMGGQGTYQQIMKNLMAIKESDLAITIKLRMNFSSSNAENIRPFLDEVADRFGGDPRFSFDLQPVGKWGGPNDEELPICTSKDANLLDIQETWYGIEKGLSSEKYGNALANHGVCYAAKENSLVVGSDGVIYKCTVAFNNPTNQVGQLYPDGKMVINPTKFSQWVSNDGVSDKHCQSCKVHPMCHGAYCPLVRIEHGSDMRPCPPVKALLNDYIVMLYKQRKFVNERAKVRS